jgi:hypothetical protein
MVPHVAVADLHAGRHLQVAELQRDRRVRDHAAADEGDLAIELRGEVGEICIRKIDDENAATTIIPACS